MVSPRFKWVDIHAWLRHAGIAVLLLWIAELWIAGFVQAAPRPLLEPGTDAAKSITSGVVMLAGILLAGFVLLLFVVVWGHRARRLAREPLPPTSRVDELWFLKPSRTKPDEPLPPPAPPTADTPPSQE